jgi:ferric-chelate reductase
MHSNSSWLYILAAGGLYVLDHLARFFRIRYAKAWLTPVHALNGGTTLIHVPSLGAGWRAGQHVRLRVVNIRWFGWWTTWFGRARPFTIATASGTGGMILPIKADGKWTRTLLRMASVAASAHPDVRSMDTERGRGPAREVRVIIEGPYGKHCVFLALRQTLIYLQRRSWLHTLYCLFRSCPRRWGQWHFICNGRTR